MPCHPLEPLGDRDELSDPFVLLDHLLEGRTLFEGLGEGHVECRRNRFRHLVGVCVRYVHHARDIADHGARLHGSERDDLRDVLAAVLARHVVDHFPAPPLAEVDVDVRQRDSFRVQEALEDEVVGDRIDVRDAEAVRDEASRSGATARTDRDPPLARVSDEVPDDQEVPGVLHLFDHFDFVAESPIVLVNRVLEGAARRELLQPGQALLETVAYDLLEVVLERESSRDVEVRKVIGRWREVHVAALGDAHRVRERLRIVLKDL